MNEELAAKRLQLLHELVPTARIVALLVDPAYPPFAESDVVTAARSFGLEIRVFNASTERDFDVVFANLSQLRAGGLVISPGTFFTARQELLAALTVRHAMPAVFESREFVVSGGLVSYGGSLADSYRLTGVYAARILKGEKPGELPVQRGMKVQLFLNLKTAKALGLTVPLSLLGRADEVIELSRRCRFMARFCRVGPTHELPRSGVERTSQPRGAKGADDPFQTNGRAAHPPLCSLEAPVGTIRRNAGG
jgi:putative tryptophan/tyrosine transport system substrate-binding protein